MLLNTKSATIQRQAHRRGKEIGHWRCTGGTAGLQECRRHMKCMGRRRLHSRPRENNREIEGGNRLGHGKGGLAQGASASRG